MPPQRSNETIYAPVEDRTLKHVQQSYPNEMSFTVSGHQQLRGHRRENSLVPQSTNEWERVPKGLVKCDSLFDRTENKK